jgi:Na+/H+-dicarboxylate symporter
MGQWLVDLVPTNPVKAAADGALLPLIVFSIALGAATSRIAPERRDAFLAITGAVQDASLVVIRVGLALAPIGVFALAFVLANRLGGAAAGAIANYIVAASAINVAACALILYPAVALFAATPVAKFARAIVPAQAVAFSARSSLAAYPAMTAVARERLGLGEPVTGFILPVVVTIFRIGAVATQLTGAVFIARLYGLELNATQYAAMALVSIATSFGVPGIPGGTIIVMLPVLLAGGLPAEGVGILLAVDTIPDMFRTTANVTGELTAAVILDRSRVRAPAGA